MSKRTLIVILLMGIILSACGGQAEQATETPTAVPPTNTSAPTNTPAPTDTPAPAESLTPEPTATEVPPDNAPDCTNSAAFVSDVTIPDNTKINVGEDFTKTWSIRNTGTCIWWSGYTLSYYSEQRMNAPDFVPLPRTNPGETANISVDLIAPSLAGTYRGNFVIKNPGELIMQVDNDSRLWLIIDAVGVLAEATSTSTAGGSSTPGTPVSCSPETDATRIQQVADAITAYRTQNSLAAYTLNTQLSQAAQAHANDMACNQFFTHQGTDGSTPQTRVATAGYTATGVAENVYGSNPPLNSDQVVNWWKVDQTDPNHNLNMISTKYTEFGVGYAFFDNYGYYVVVYATP